MGGVFYCGACEKRQQGGRRFIVTQDNVESVRRQMAATGKEALAACVAVGTILCTVTRVCRVVGSGDVDAPACFGEADQAAIKSSLVGRPVTKLLSSATLTGTAPAMVEETAAADDPGETAHFCALCDGTIAAAVGDDGSHVAQFQTPAGSRSVQLSAQEVEEALQSHLCLAQLLRQERTKAENAAQKRATRAAANAERELEAERAKNARAQEKARASMAADPSNRQMRWSNMLDPVWWSTWGDKVSPSLHRSLFGFATPSMMRNFFEVFFDEEALLPDEIGLSQYQLYALALMRMRRGETVQTLAALTGANRGRLGVLTAVWIHRLGAVGRMLVGVPEMEYLMESMPASFTECGMGKVAAIGDATDFMTETIRSPFMKKVKLMQWSDKVHHSAARGTSFCSANGMTIIALALTFGRSSELNCVKACARWLKQLPSWVHVAYDKGIRGMRSLLPNLNFTFMPCFLAPAKGKTQFTPEEAIESRGIARNRYVVEITYKRVKEWKLLREVVASEHFHLMNSTWLWALGFSNLCHRFLQPPPAVETNKQRTRRQQRKRTEAAAAVDDLDELRHAATAATAAMEV